MNWGGRHLYGAAGVLLFMASTSNAHDCSPWNNNCGSCHANEDTNGWVDTDCEYCHATGRCDGTYSKPSCSSGWADRSDGCAPPPPPPCEDTNSCGPGQGDCDYDSECTGNLVCGSNNCGGSYTCGAGSTSPCGSYDDCCEAPPPPACEDTSSCGLGQGDCDTDYDCTGNLVCGSYNCGGSYTCGAGSTSQCGSTDSCCTAATCADTNSCGLGQGDCDTDYDCTGNLVCGSYNCGGSYTCGSDGRSLCSGSDSCCTAPTCADSSSCGLGQGDCDTSLDCTGNLMCGTNNCGGSYTCGDGTSLCASDDDCCTTAHDCSAWNNDCSQCILHDDTTGLVNTNCQYCTTTGTCSGTHPKPDCGGGDDPNGIHTISFCMAIRYMLPGVNWLFLKTMCHVRVAGWVAHWVDHGESCTGPPERDPIDVAVDALQCVGTAVGGTIRSLSQLVTYLEGADSGSTGGAQNEESVCETVVNSVSNLALGRCDTGPLCLTLGPAALACDAIFLAICVINEGNNVPNPCQWLLQRAGTDPRSICTDLSTELGEVVVGAPSGILPPATPTPSPTNTCSSCSTTAQFTACTTAVNSACCDDPTEDCSSGQPATCNSGCAAVLTPMATACDAFLASQSWLAAQRTALGQAAARCSTGH
jgi:hypothetical protein